MSLGGALSRPREKGPLPAPEQTFTLARKRAFFGNVLKVWGGGIRKGIPPAKLSTLSS